jgi:hypothetical protein
MNTSKLLSQISITLKRLLIISAFSFALPQAASAATLDDVVQSIRALHSYIEAVVNKTAQQLAEKMYEANPNMPATIVGNQGQQAAKMGVTNNTYRLTLDQTRQALSIKGPVDKSKQDALSDIIASDSLLIPKSQYNALLGNSPNEQINIAAGDGNFDFETFLGINAYTPTREAQAIRDASPLQVKEYLATRRSTNPQWYDDMSKASPATVSRETLFVLAEIRQELFNIQQQNERMLATMSAMGGQLNMTGKTNLKRLEGEVKEKINTTIKGLPAPTPAGLPAGTPSIPGMPSS